MPPKKDCSTCAKKIASSYGNKLGSNPKPKNKSRELTAVEKDLFKKHNHSAQHIADMKRFLKAGRGCFADAHAFALKQK
tara:strand:+ start:786 stop:1022 length:237 start_codon:yes stop_codon:yes gene_type:complete